MYMHVLLYTWLVVVDTLIGECACGSGAGDVIQWLGMIARGIMSVFSLHILEYQSVIP